MGNFSSGRSTSRRTTNDMHRLDVRKLQREGHLEAGNSLQWQWSYGGGEVIHRAQIQAFRHHITISHAGKRVQGELAQDRYDIAMERTPCNLGGHRLWWCCPAIGCNRRVAILYGGNGAIFACRHCYNLNYRSQRESLADRSISRLNKLRQRLGWLPGGLNAKGGKPTRMRWQTYWRLERQHDDLLLTVLSNLSQRYGNCLQRLKRQKMYSL